MNEERYYRGIIKLHETEDVESANRLLALGNWELIGLRERSVSTVGEDGKFTTVTAPAYVLGFTRPGDMGPAPEATGKQGPPKASQDLSANALEASLEGLTWVQASSKKCDFVKDPPADLIAAVRASKDGVKGARHHFTAHATDPVLFRFGRGQK